MRNDGRAFAPWAENAGGMNTKGELPDLPPNSSPLQFGDWLHLIAPVMVVKHLTRGQVLLRDMERK